MNNGVRVQTGARLHIGFRNLAPDGDRLFGGIGLAIERPQTSVTAVHADAFSCEDTAARRIAKDVRELIGANGANVTLEEVIPAHEGLGSGTQLTLAIYDAMATMVGYPGSVREAAAVLGRGRRSGVGVACYESGGFIVDAGHPTDAVLAGKASDSPVPPVEWREPIPEQWRFLLVRPAIKRGRCGAQEAASIERTIANADTDIADEISDTLTNTVISGIRNHDIHAFGRGITHIDSLTGKWFQQEQGERYRPPCDALVESISTHENIFGWGQSSWGPLIYAITTAEQAPVARDYADSALQAANLDGTVDIVAPRNDGAHKERVQDQSLASEGRKRNERCQN